MSRKVNVKIKDSATGVEKAEEVVLGDAVARLVDSGAILNDSDGVFFQRQLEYIQAQSYDVLYPNLKGREVFALNTEGGEGVNTITYRSYDKRGETKVIAGKATDLPRSDISGKEYSIQVKTLGSAYGYSRQELAASNMTGLPLDARKAEATRRSYEEKVNELIWFGDAENNLGGLFGGPANGPWSTIGNSAVASAAGGGNSKVWGVDKTPTEVLADLTSACSDMVSDTLQIFAPNKILMSVAKRNYLMNTRMSEYSDVSILNWFITNNAYITSADQIVAINELDGVFGATPGAGAGGNGFVVMQEGADNARVREPFPLINLPVQYQGLEFEINCYGRFAGLEIIRPDAIAFYYGV